MCDRERSVPVGCFRSIPTERDACSAFPTPYRSLNTIPGVGGVVQDTGTYLVYARGNQALAVPQDTGASARSLATGPPATPRPYM